MIKIDVEGLEREVLQGAKNVIEKHTPIISIESLLKSHNQEDHDKSRDDLISIIGATRYKLYFSYGSLPGPYTYVFVPKL